MNRVSELIAESLGPLDGCKAVGFVAVNAKEHSGRAITAVARSLYENLSARVVVVDANLRRPLLDSTVGESPSLGLADLLADPDLDLDRVVYSDIEEFDLVVAGKNRNNGRVSSEALVKAMETLTKRYDIVLVDVGPVTHCLTHWGSLSAFDGMILTIKCEATRWEAAQRAHINLESAGGKVLAAILDQRKFYVPKWLYNLT